MAALDLLRTRTDTTKPKRDESITSEQKISAIYIPDYLTCGTWTTSQSFSFADERGNPVGRATIGNGFIQQELPNFFSTALHDLLVGLLCFDRIYFPLHGLGKLYSDLGSASFWNLVNSDVFRFVWKTSDLAIVFGGSDSVSDGAISCLTVRSPNNPNSDRGLPEVLAAQLPAESATEDGGAKLLAKFEKITIKFDDSILANHPVLAQDALLFPRLRTAIGLSDGILPSRIPDWFVFPALRVAMVVQDAEICRLLGASAAKMPFGSDSLANTAYGITSTNHSASDFANYVVAGRFRADLGAMVIKQPELLQKILRFRDTSEGSKFREEIFNLLRTNEGGEFVASVNSMLKSAVPVDVLERARDHFVNVSFSPEHVSVMSGAMQEADLFLPWRKRSAEMLRAVCAVKKIGSYDFCPCGSGDKLKFCCGTLFHH